MVAARARRIVLPQRPRLLRHVREVALRLVEDLPPAPRALQQLQAQIVADEGVGGPDLGVLEHLLPVRRVVALRAEVRKQRLPERGMRLGRRDPVEEGVVLARLRAFARKLERTVLLADGVVAEPRARPALAAHRRPHARRLGGEVRPPVEAVHRVERVGPCHVRGVVHVPHELVRAAPLHEHPARQAFEQAVRVAVLPEERHELLQTRAQGVNKGAVARAPQILLRLKDKPHAPVRDVGAVAVVGGVAHRQRPGRDVVERGRQRQVLLEDALQREVARQERGGGGREVGVAVPARALAARAVHEHVHRVLAEGLVRRVEDRDERGVARAEAGALRRRVLVAAEARRRDDHLARDDVQLHVAHRVGLEGVHLVDARRREVPHERVAAVLVAADAARLAVRGQHLVKLENEPPGLLHLHAQAREARVVEAVVEDHRRARRKRERRGCLLGVRRRTAVRADEALGEVGDVQFEIREREALEGRRRPRQRECAVGVDARRLVVADVRERDGRHARVHLEVRVRRPACDERRLRRGGEREGGRVHGRGQAVRLRERALEGIARHLLDARLARGGEGPARPLRGGAHIPAAHHLRLEERRLFHQVEVRHIVPRHLDAQLVAPRLRGLGEVPFVGPEEPLRSARRAKPDERAVQRHPIGVPRDHLQDGPLPRLQLEGRAERDERVHLLGETRRPDGLRRLEFRHRPRRARTPRREEEQDFLQDSFHGHSFFGV